MMIEILSNMQWPAAFAVIGISWAIAVPLIIRRATDKQEKIEQFKLKRAIQLEQFKKGALTLHEEP